jgi:hypothetical protein
VWQRLFELLLLDKYFLNLHNIAADNRYVLQASCSTFLNENILDANNMPFTQKFAEQPESLYCLKVAVFNAYKYLARECK